MTLGSTISNWQYVISPLIIYGGWSTFKILLDIQAILSVSCPGGLMCILGYFNSTTGVSISLSSVTYVSV